MPYSYAVYTGNGSTTQFNVTFPYIRREHVVASIDYVNATFTWVNNTTIAISPAPGNGTRVEVRRVTPVNTPLVDFADGSTLVAADLDTNALQQTYINQEQDDQFADGISINSQGLLDAGGKRITDVGDPTSAQDAATKTYVDTFVSQTANIANGAVTTAKIADGAVTTAKIADDNVTTGKIANSNVTTAKIADSNVTTAKIADSNVTTAKIADSNVTTVKIADSNVTTAKIADGNVTSAKIADGNVTTGKIADANVTEAKLATGAVTSAKIADGTIATADIGNSQVTGAKIADDTITSAKLTGATVVTNSEHSGSTPNDTSFFTTSASDARYFRQDSSETITSGNPWSSSDSYVATTAAIDARVIDLVDDVGGFVPIENETSFPVANPDINNPDGTGTIVSIKEMVTSRTPVAGTVTIANGSGANTVTITGCGSTVLASGFGVLVETTATLHTYAFHRLVPKATEVTTVAGISGDVTTVAGISSNVTSVASNATNITTVATNITNVNNVGGSIANVNSVASNLGTVNDFAARYRVAATDPVTDLDTGDLVFNTGSNELRVYNGSAWQGGVTATGNLMSKSGDTMTGPLGITAGTNSLPSLFFSGDPNTGLYSPGADQLGITTGGTARLTVAADGTVNVVGSLTKGGSAVVTVGDTGTVTSTMILDGTIVDGDISASAEIAVSKLADGSARQLLQTDSAGTGVEWTSNVDIPGTLDVTGATTLDSTLSVPLGSNSAPTIHFGTDTNTGIYSPGADQVAISTSGTGRLFVNSAGKITVGGSTPLGLLNLVRVDLPSGTVNYTSAEVNGKAQAGLNWYQDQLANYEYYLDVFASATSEAPWGGSNIRFLTTLNGTATASERMRITRSGNVGIGTTSPNTPLQIGSFANNQALALAAGTANTCAVYFADGTGADLYRGYVQYSHVDDSLQFGTSSTERGRFDSSGRLLVGTSSASGWSSGAKVVVQDGSNATYQGITLGNSGDGTTDITLSAWSGSGGSVFVQKIRAITGGLAFLVSSASSADATGTPTEAMRINGDQELLIGYTSDNGAYKLQVNSQIFATSATVATSDGRYKENVASLGGCLDLVKALRPVSFTWKQQQDITRTDDEGNEVLVREGHNFPQGTQVGFIAQEVQEVLTDKPWLSSVIKENVRPAVLDSKGNELAPEEQFFGIAEGNLIAVLTNALQEAVAQIETLKDRVAALEGV